MKCPVINFEPVALMDETMNTSKVCNGLSEIVRIKSTLGEPQSGNSKNETEVTSHSESNETAVSELQSNDGLVFGTVLNGINNEVGTVLSEKSENESLLRTSSIGTSNNGKEVTSCNESNKSIVSAIPGNEMSDFGTVSSNSEVVDTSSDTLATESEESSRRRKNETEVTSRNESNERAKSGPEDKDMDFGNSEVVGTSASENLGIELLLEESSSSLEHDTGHKSHNVYYETETRSSEGNVNLEFGRIRSNCEEVVTILHENLEMESPPEKSLSESLMREAEGSSCSVCANKAASGSPGNAEPGIGITMNCQEVGTTLSKNFKIVSGPEELSNESLKTVVHSRNKNGQMTVSTPRDDVVSDSEIASNDKEEARVVFSETPEVESESGESLSEGSKDETDVSRSLNAEVAALDSKQNAEVEFGTGRNNFCEEVGATYSEVVKIEPGLEETPNGTVRDELELRSPRATGEMNVIDFLRNADCEFEETSFLTFLGVKVEREDMDEIELTQESVDYFCSSAMCENEEARVAFGNGCLSIKKEVNSDECSACYGNDLSFNPFDSKQIVGDNSEPWSGYVTRSKVNYDSNSIKLRPVSVKLEDLFPSSSRKLGKAHSNIGLCACIYCRGEYRYSDSQHQLKNRRNRKQLVHSKDTSSKLGKGVKHRQPSDSKICLKVQGNKNSSVNTCDKLGIDLKYQRLSDSKKCQKVRRNASFNTRNKSGENLKHRPASNSEIHQKVRRKKKSSVIACGKVGKELKYQQPSDSKIYQKGQRKTKLSVEASDKVDRDLKYERLSDLKVRHKMKRNKNPSVKACGKLGKDLKYQRHSDSKICKKAGRNKSIFQCNECSLKCKDRNALNLHLTTHGRGFRCKFCDQRFLPRAALFAHLKIHNIEKPFKCELCPMKFLFPSFLEAHLRKHSKEKPFKCKVCSARFAHNSSVKVHMRTHSDERPIKCAQCPMTFKFRSNLTVHMRTHSGQKPFFCDQCPLKFLTSTNLKTHLRVHSGEKPYECKLCAKRFQSSSILGTHVKLHNGLKPYKCNQCPASFAQSSSLYTHLRNLHSDARPYECKLCPANYKWNHQLVTHMRMHRGEERYKCDMCPARFSQSTTLKIHLRRHSSEDPLSCAFCSARYKRKTNMILHLKTCH